VGGHLVRSAGERWLCGMIALVAVAAGLLGAVGTVGAHSGDVIDATWASAPPTVDGSMSPGEWAGAASVDLGAIPGNQLAAFFLLTSNDTFLWVAYDAVGDTSATTNDSASFAFDTGHDGAATDGAEDEFYLGDLTGHLVWRGGAYAWEDVPFNPSLPNHAGLAGARGRTTGCTSSRFHWSSSARARATRLGFSAGPTPRQGSWTTAGSRTAPGRPT